MNLNYKNILGLAIVLVLSVSFTLLYKSQNNTKIAYIDLQKTFQDFELKKELEAKLIKVKNQRQHILDSLEFELKVLSKDLNNNSKPDEKKVSLFQAKREVFLTRKQEFMEENENLSAQFDGQIFKQMNQYIKDFGQKKSYTYIFGANGQGVLMYAKESEDITEDVLSYINDRYKGDVK
jgi:outer membrane protein